MPVSKRSSKSAIRRPTSVIPRNVGTLIRRADDTTSSVVRRLTQAANTVATATGWTVTSSAVTGSSSEWANMAARYSEARVLSIKVFYLPNSSAATVIAACDRSGAQAAPTTPALAWSNSGPRLLNLNSTAGRIAHFEARARDLEDFNFDPVASMTSRFAIQSYNASGSTVTYYTEWIVEFRGVR